MTNFRVMQPPVFIAEAYLSAFYFVVFASVSLVAIAVSWVNTSFQLFFLIFWFQLLFKDLQQFCCLYCRQQLGKLSASSPSYHAQPFLALVDSMMVMNSCWPL